jgi:hypothetical protein
MLVYTEQICKDAAYRAITVVAAYIHDLDMTTSNQIQAREVPLPAHRLAP